MQAPADPIPWARPHYWGDESRLVLEALESTWISGGPFVDRLEEALKGFLGVPHALLAANGTAALHLAFLGIGIQPGDEVIVPGFGFLAAANVALLMGARPVFAEVDPQTWCLDPQDAAARVTAHTRAMVAVHTYGNVCDLDALRAVADAHGIALVEDAAEAFGSRWGGVPAGTAGRVGTFSFHATKTISTGEGGLVVTADPLLAEKMALFRSHGMRRRTFYWHEVPGHNFRLTNLQAALGYAQFLHLEEIFRHRRRIDEAYRRHLEGQAGLTLQHFAPQVTPVVWALALSLDPAVFPQGRDEVMQRMRASGIETRPGFYPPGAQSVYPPVSLPVCEAVSRQIVSLPTHPSLSDQQIAFICRTLLELRR